MGLKVLISFYNGDTLVTQDAHNNHTVSTHPVYSELKFERGFYLDQPVDKIVIEFIEDTQFPKLFYKGKMYNSTTERFFDCKYGYQNEVEQRQAPVMGKIFTDVKYKNNKFTFKGNQGGNRQGSGIRNRQRIGRKRLFVKCARSGRISRLRACSKKCRFNRKKTSRPTCRTY